MITRILAVDDEPDLELVLSQKFRKQVRNNELQLLFAANGVEALQLLQTHGDIDVVLSDINMPEMDGLTLLEKIHAQYPLLRVVMVSAYGDMKNIRAALNRGAFDFVTKPIDFADLEITLSKTILAARAIKQAAHNRDRLLAIHRDLEVARQIQQAMVPRSFPASPAFVLSGAMIPAREVGGDFYDFFMIDEERLGFVIGDVSDKGVAAAMFMALSKTLLKSTALKGLPPQECLQELNRVLYFENTAAMFVTIFYGILHLRTGAVDYCNGGHPSPYRLGKDGDLTTLPATGGLALGALDHFEYAAQQTVLQPGEGIFLYTDGVTEAMNRAGEQFTEARLQEHLQTHAHAAPANLIAEVSTQVNAFAGGASQADDITMLALRFG
ncbi:SpoIIE family protein phosphatase [bacterium]|nr:SpoIIE family protein phosphatase [bacterium]NUM75770.1 SpoIIE family protein phosphatase [candidate division KSB1 bacterium]